MSHDWLFIFGVTALALRVNPRLRRRHLSLILLFVSIKLLILNLSSDISGIALEGILYINLRLTMVAVATERHIHVLTANEGRNVLGRSAEGKACALLA